MKKQLDIAKRPSPSSQSPQPLDPPAELIAPVSESEEVAPSTPTHDDIAVALPKPKSESVPAWAIYISIIIIFVIAGFIYYLLSSQ